MYCGKCGAANAADAVFCSECGASMTAVQSQNTLDAELREKEKNKKIGMIALGLVAVIIIVIVASIVFSSISPRQSYKYVIDTYMGMLLDGEDAETVEKIVPAACIDALPDLRSDVGKIMEYLQMLDYFYDEWEIGYEITDVEDMSAKDVISLQREYEDNAFDVKIAEAKIVTIEMTLYADGEESPTEVELTVIKVGSSWYLDPLSMYNVL